MLDEYVRCEDEARYIIKTGATVRVCALYFGVSKSTVHKDVSSKLKYVNYGLWLEAGEVLARNKAQRHLRGGEATRKKYMEKKLTADG